MPKQDGQFIKPGETFGVEIEVPSISREEMHRSSLVKKGLCFETRDASVESRRYKLEELTISNSKFQVEGAKEKVTGVELVSGIRDDSREEALRFFEEIAIELKNYGETSVDYRCGIHFHISMVDSLRVLKAIVRLAMHLESVFFYIGGMGYAFRGIGNDSAYMRPITENGPLYVPTGSGYRPTFVPEELLQSKSTSEFWTRYGDSSRMKGSRYVPVRYHWINLFSILKQGSLEFRIFNLSLNYKHIVSALELCRAFSRFCLNTNLYAMKSLGFNSVNSIYYNQSKEEVLDTFNMFSAVTELNETDAKILRDIIARTPKIELENTPRLCHLKNMGEHWRGSESYRPEITRRAEQLQKTKILDIHVLNGE